jgi:uncharacterized protein (TIGR02145 family)
VKYQATIGCISFLSLFLLYNCSPGQEHPDDLSLVLTVTDVTVFNGHDGSVMLDVTGGITPYSYLWSNGEMTKDIEGVPAGIYSVTVTDARDSSATATDTVKHPIPENLLMDIQGNIYTTVRIGEQIWMQQNLRVSVDPDSTPITSYVYDGIEELAKTYGRLYTWDAAMNGSTAEKAQGICPDGWHIPSDEEWKILEMYLGMTRAEADLSNVWRGEGVGAKLRPGGGSGYDVLYSGRRANSGGYALLRWYEYVWTSTESGSYAWRRCLDSIPSVTTIGRFNTFPKSYGFSVRCIKNNPK